MLKPTDFPSMGDLSALNEWNRIAEADRIREHHMKAMTDRSLPIVEGDMPQEDYPDLRNVERVEPYMYVCAGSDIRWIRSCLLANRALIGNTIWRINDDSKPFDTQLEKEKNIGLDYIPSKDEQAGIYTTMPMAIVNALINITNNSENTNRTSIDDTTYQNMRQGYINWENFRTQQIEEWDW